MTTQGQSGSTLYMVNHGFSTAALFLIAGFLISRRGSRLIADFGGVQKVAPLLAGTFLVAGLSSLALPGLSSFVSEFLVLVGTFTRYQVGRGHRDARHRARRALHPADVPADDDRPGADEVNGSCRDLRAARDLASRRCSRSSSRSASTRSRCSTSSTRRSTARMQPGRRSTDPAPTVAGGSAAKGRRT